MSSAFGEQNHRVEAEEFDGADIEASFGSVRLDLRNAIINDDVQIHIKASFAGVGIYVPKDVNVDVRSNSAFGGVNNKTADRLRQQTGSHTIHLIAECSFAGVEVM
ncbi:MAG: LiaF-related protein [Alistipes sp.]|nr:LiaF-related protein [Alistipes sp.]